MNTDNTKLLWLAVSFLCAVLAVLTSPATPPPVQQSVQPIQQSVQQLPAPIEQPAPPEPTPQEVKAEPPSSELDKEVKAIAETEEPAPEPTEYTIPQRYKDMGLAREKMNPDPDQRYRDMGLARFRMGQEKFRQSLKQEKK